MKSSCKICPTGVSVGAVVGVGSRVFVAVGGGSEGVVDGSVGASTVGGMRGSSDGAWQALAHKTSNRVIDKILILFIWHPPYLSALINKGSKLGSRLFIALASHWLQVIVQMSLDEPARSNCFGRINPLINHFALDGVGSCISIPIIQAPCSHRSATSGMDWRVTSVMASAGQDARHTPQPKQRCGSMYTFPSADE